MSGIKIFKSNDTEPKPLFGEGEEAGWIRKIIYPPHADTKCTFIATAEVNPGYSPHTWHVHAGYKTRGIEVAYPENFEEIYYIVSGSGVVQWKREDGCVEEKKVTAGDAILFPAGAPEHQLVNNGSEKIFVVISGGPPPDVRASDAP